MTSLRRLVLIRHAQAETFAASDVERELTDVGRRDASALGRWLREQGIAPDQAWVSTAVRTRQTWSAVASAAGWRAEPHVDGALYSSDEGGVLEVVRVAGDDVSTVVVVGHNPTIGMLIQLLDDGTSTTVDSAEIVDVPPATAAVFTWSGAWSEIGPMTGQLTHFHVVRSGERA